MSDLLTQSEFAKHRGVSRKTVTVWKHRGDLVWRDGKVDCEATDTWLDSRSADSASNNDSKPEVTGNSSSEGCPSQPSAETADSSPAGSSLRTLIDNLELLSKAEAERVKENYLALQRRLEYERAAGELVPVNDAAQEVASEYAAVRSKLLSLPTELAPVIAQEAGGDANQIRERLAEGITRALEELSNDGG